MLGPRGEPGGYLALVSVLAQYIEKINAEKRRKEEQNAALILFSAGLLVISIRELNNRLRHVAHDLTMFHIDASGKEREEIIAKFSDFIIREQVTQIVEKSIGELDNLLKGDFDFYRESVNIIVNAGKQILNSKYFLHDPNISGSEVNFYNFLDSIRNADTEEDALPIREFAARLIPTINSQIVSEAERAYGTLKSQLSMKYPLLPTPPL